MPNTLETTLDSKQLCIYPASVPNAPVVYASMFFEVGRPVIRACKKLGCPSFTLVSLSHLHWDEELSPWPADPVVSKDDHFSGKANAYARWLGQAVVPYAEAYLEHQDLLSVQTLHSSHEQATPLRIIAGYSMGGLFALYAPYVSDLFWGVVSGSGSVWFPGFLAYVHSHEFLRIPQAVYLSLGNKESHTTNPALAQTESITQALYHFYQTLSIPSVFELNPGNHYQHADKRLAQGITWILKEQAAQAQNITPT